MSSPDDQPIVTAESDTSSADPVVLAQRIVSEKMKPSRPVNIVNPQTPEDRFIMFGKTCAAARKDAFEEMKKTKEALERDLMSLPYIYVKSDEDLRFLHGLGHFSGDLYIGPNVSDEVIEAYERKYAQAKITTKVVALSKFT